MSKTRCFVAVELSDEVRARLGEARYSLVALAPGWADEKWVAPQNLHLTLKFLGSLSDNDLACVHAGLHGTLAGMPPFSVVLAGVASVPRPARAEMIWARLGDSEGRCAELAARVDAAAVSCGLPAEDRRFAAHVTLARARKPRPLLHEALTGADAVVRRHPLSMSVLSVTLFASTLTRTGPVYEIIESWVLSGPPADAQE